MEIPCRRAIANLFCAAVLSLMTLSAGAQTPASNPATRPALASLAGVPLYFEANLGQADASARFLARGRNYQFLIAPTESRLVLRKVMSPVPASPFERDIFMAPRSVLIKSVRLEFAGARAQARIRGAEEPPGKINYFIGSDPAQWHTGVATYAKVQVENLYPGINLAYYGNQQQLEYDFTVSPGTDPGAIAIRFEGADKVTLDETGELVLTLGADQVRQRRPVLYQLVGGARRPVVGGYRLKDARTVEFAVGAYDHTLPLVIDPVLSYSTYFGGNSGDLAFSVKVDANGFVYLAGETLSTSFPFAIPPGAFTSTFQGGANNGDAFVAKLGNTGTNLVYFTYLGGSGDDGALDLAVDRAGNAYVTGFTDSTNFPTRNALYPQISGTQDPKLHVFPVDVFVAELNTNGSGLVYSTYLGGSDVDVAGGIAVDPAGSAYITGYTQSTNFPTKNPLVFTLVGVTNTQLDQLAGGRDPFVAKLAPNGTNLVYSTYLGGASLDEGQGIAADAAGFAYVTGYTASTNFPITTNALQPFLNNSTNLSFPFDAFLSKIDINGSNLLYSTFLGGSNSDAGFRLALDGFGNAYITGASRSPELNTVTNIPNLTFGSNGTNVVNDDAFLAKISFNSNGAAVVYVALFGGTNSDVGWDVGVDAAGDAFVVGTTLSVDFPTTRTSGFLRATNSGFYDLFVTAFNTNASALLYSAYLGGSSDDYGYGIAVDPAGNAYIVGRTFSADFPTQGAFTSAVPLQTLLTGGDDAFLAKILMDPTLAAAGIGNTVQLQWRAFSSEFGLQASTNVASPAAWAPVAQPPVLSNGWHTVTLPATNAQSFFRLKR